LEVTAEAMEDHSIPKGQPRKRPGSAWWRCEQILYSLYQYHCRLIGEETDMQAETEGYSQTDREGERGSDEL